MADSIRELILQSFAAKLALITTANGYPINVITVDRARRTFETKNLPAVSIFDGEETAVQAFNFDRNTMIVSVDMHSDAFTQNRSVHANSMVASLKKAILSADTTHSGKAERTYITGVQVRYPPEDDETKMTVSIAFTVDYEEVTGNPYSNP